MLIAITSDFHLSTLHGVKDAASIAAMVFYGVYYFSEMA
jgi:hypothetical protein